MNRRHFLMTSAGVLAAARRATPSPNDTVRIACVGLRGRGKDHIGGYTQQPHLQIGSPSGTDESVPKQNGGPLRAPTHKQPPRSSAPTHLPQRNTNLGTPIP